MGIGCCFTTLGLFLGAAVVLAKHHGNVSCWLPYFSWFVRQGADRALPVFNTSRPISHPESQTRHLRRFCPHTSRGFLRYPAAFRGCVSAWDVTSLEENWKAILEEETWGLTA